MTCLSGCIYYGDYCACQMTGSYKLDETTTDHVGSIAATTALATNFVGAFLTVLVAWASSVLTLFNPASAPYCKHMRPRHPPAARSNSTAPAESSNSRIAAMLKICAVTKQIPSNPPTSSLETSPKHASCLACMLPSKKGLCLAPCLESANRA